MKKIGHLIENITISKNNNIVDFNINKLLSNLSLNTSDPMVTLQINFFKWLGLPNKLKEEESYSVTGRLSTIIKVEKEEIGKRKKDGWEVTLRTEERHGIAFNNKQELVVLKKYLGSRCLNNKDKVRALNDLLNDFISSHTTYGKDTLLLKTAYFNKLHIYPMSYLNKVLTTDYWNQKFLPALSEIETALRYCDGLKSQAFWEINAVITDTTDYNDEF